MSSLSSTGYSTGGSAQLCKTLNGIEQLIADPRLTAEGALQQVKAHLAVYHSQVLHE
jgi:hypothetical protein